MFVNVRDKQCKQISLLPNKFLIFNIPESSIRWAPDFAVATTLPVASVTSFDADDSALRFLLPRSALTLEATTS